jgi:polyphosphate kinase 2 (PPK2 family)
MHALIPDGLLSELGQMQQSILKKGLPVLILFEGSSGRVIGRVNGELIRCLEPRGVIYHHFDPVEYDGPRSLLDFLLRSPGKGQIGLFDRSWYSAIIERYNEEEKKQELDSMLDMANSLEGYLVRNGVLLIKIILRADHAAVKEYGPLYGPSAPRRSFLSADHIDPAKYRETLFEQVYLKTNTEYAPWTQIKVREVEATVLETTETILRIINERLMSETPARTISEIKRVYPNPREGLDLKTKCPRYEETINELSERLAELQMALSLSNRSLVVCFEGWDAAGKGSCIKHLCHALNPRGYRVFQTGVPTEEESKHTYLWRFIKGVPEKGHITVFDRTWYGRMMVEVAEGLCSEEEYRRSPSEMISFERMMIRGGTILIKFWLDITKDEQLDRFKKREGDPLKQWKITADDWRNRSKWEEYDKLVNVMIESTNAEFAPWTVVSANDKKYARVEVIRTVVETLNKELKK